MEATPHVKLYIVETAFGDRMFEVTDSNNPHHLQLRTNQEIWHKENMINLAEKRLLPRDWKYMATVDGDVFFASKHWAIESIHRMQHYPVIQPWSDAIDLGPQGTVIGTFKSFSSHCYKGIKQNANITDEYPYGHSGFAWCYTRRAFENFYGGLSSGLLDFAVLGSADHHMAWSLIGQVEKSLEGRCDPPGYQEMCISWQRPAFRVTNGNLGFLPGRIEHRFHGPKLKRFYKDRRKILATHAFDPKMDLAYDEQGLLYLCGKPQLQNDLRHYMASRAEDSTEEY